MGILDTIKEAVSTEEVKQEKVAVKEVKKETKKQETSWFLNTDAK
jgi:hypothetical protein